MADKKILFVDPEFPSEGIEIWYSKKAREFTIAAWYDNLGVIDATSISLEDFCVQLGITKKDLPPWAE